MISFCYGSMTRLERVIFDLCEFIYKYKVILKVPASTSSATQASSLFQVKSLDDAKKDLVGHSPKGSKTNASLTKLKKPPLLDSYDGTIDPHSISRTRILKL